VYTCVRMCVCEGVCVCECVCVCVCACARAFACASKYHLHRNLQEKKNYAGGEKHSPH
jgi:hypothetical protein